MSSVKNLSIAFCWHMHQPVYQMNYESDYLLPWVRLHTVKHYFPMIMELSKFKSLKLNFNIVPTLLDSIIDYSGNATDICSSLTLKDTKNLTPDDKEFILNNFFDAEYSSMILPYEEYNRLYQKRFTENCGIDDFTSQEYADILALFNLVWIDDSLYQKFPDIKKLLKKGKNFSLKDRKKIIDIYKKIMKMFVPACKRFLKSKSLEMLASPFYHPIMPIMMNIGELQQTMSSIDGSLSDLNMSDSAKEQMVSSITHLEKVFGIKIKGSWMPEMGLNKDVLNLLSELNIKWTMSDEGILSKSTGYSFERDYRGHLEDPYHLMKPYKFNNISVIFRDSLIPDMINYEYANQPSDEAAKDLYDRIKVIQDKLKNSPDEKHLLTIALDCENCWNYYSENGRIFLEKVYSMIENDDSLETVLVSEYLEKDEHKKELKDFKAGTWKNIDFQMWIGEPVKNLAWSYIKNVKKDMDKIISQNKKGINSHLAKKELYLCQGSDWFWWYGEPNNSGQDHLFDFLFREHLKSVYRYLNEEYPKYLDIPLISTMVTENIENDIPITPSMNGLYDDCEWDKAHSVEVPEGPELQGQKIFERICYCADRDKFYIRLYLAQNQGAVNPFLHQMYIYMKNPQREQYRSSVRLICKNENISPVMKETFHNELRISMMDKKLYPIRFTQAIDNNLWAIHESYRIQVVYNEVIDIAIPFEELDVRIGETMQFFFANTNFGIKDAFSPQDIMLTIKRL